MIDVATLLRGAAARVDPVDAALLVAHALARTRSWRYAHGDDPVEEHAVVVESLGPQRLARLRLHTCVERIGRIGVELVESLQARARVVVLHVGHQHPERREGPLPRRHDHLGDSQLTRHVDSDESPAAAE